MRVRITLAAAVVTALAVGFAGWLLLRTLESQQLDEVRDDMEEQLGYVVEQLEAGATPEEALSGEFPVPYVEVTDEDGEVFLPLGMNQSSMPDGPTENGSPELDDADRTGAMTTPDGDVVAGPLETIQETVDTDGGTYHVSASAPVGQVAQVERSVDALQELLFVGLPALVLLVAAIAWVLVGRALRPVEAIRAEVDEITGTTMHRRVPEPGTDDEIGRLARTMNAMLTRLDESATRQRQFVSDASHELRSPVAAIRTGLEVARHKGPRADWIAVADRALADEARLEALLDDLLLLAAFDENSTTALPPTKANLAAIAAAEAEGPRPVAVTVVQGSDGSGLAVVQGATDQLARVVSNLLDNAARHASSTVQARVARHDDTVRLTVDDDGPGIPAADRERVFERFTRLDDGRARQSGGSGLGLAVVRSIVTRHHGRVWAEDSPLGGARFVVELPATEAAIETRVRVSPRAG